MKKPMGFTHDNIKNISVEWYTPPWIFEKLNIKFDLDPCHPSEKLSWIPVNKTISLPEDGLTSVWEGMVWLNPPYGKYTGDWLKKMHSHRCGIALVFARTDCLWYHNYVAKSDAILYLKGRIGFVDGFGVTGGSGAGCGSILVAWGSAAVEALIGMSNLGDLNIKNFEFADLI